MMLFAIGVVIHGVHPTLAKAVSDESGDDHAAVIEHHIEHRAVDHVETVIRLSCGQTVEIRREEPWLLTGGEQ